VTGAATPVLLGYDGSPSSATAITVAGQLLAPRKAVICHVWSGLSRAMLHAEPAALPGVLRDAAQELDDADATAGAQVAADGAERARAAGFDATPLPEREHGKTWRTLLEAGDRSDASVIAVGAHGLSGIGRAVLGSVSTALVHHSSIPVLVVPATTPEEGTGGPLLLCYDGSDGAKRAIAVASRVFEARKALVFHTWESWVAEAPALAGVTATVHGMAVELDQAADEQSEDRTAEGVEIAGHAGFHAEGLSERAEGPVWKAVLDAADRNASAAIVVGARGLTGISAALGSVSNGVVHHSRRPVLVVSPETDR